MRLLNTSTLRLTEFIGNIPVYAILSHTWETDEVLFEDLDRDPRQKAGWKKVTNACKIALTYSYDWIWIDTCCIDKSSSAELSESINSMFEWYQKSFWCIAYLSDVSCRPVGSQELFGEMALSRWFTRGWTLQELLAPRSVSFYSSDWRLIASKPQISSNIASITGIDEIYLKTDTPINDASVARRMSWAAKRNTTRVEDMAYCLLGLFQVNMPLIYGEGKRALRRLQEAILREVDDQSILAWGRMAALQEIDIRDRHNPKFGFQVDLLANSPEDFEHSGDIITFRTRQVETVLQVQHGGIAVSAPFWKGPEHGNSFLRVKDVKSFDMLVPLQCRREKFPLECIALSFTSPSPTAHESGVEKKRIPCYRVSSFLFPVQTAVWAAKRRKLMLMFKEEDSRRQRLRNHRNRGFVLRTLPQWRIATQMFPLNHPRAFAPFRSPVGMSRLDVYKKLSRPTIVRLHQTDLPDLALVIQALNTAYHHIDDTFSPKDIVARIVVLPTGYSLGEVGDVIERETQNWSPEEITTAAEWRGACTTSEPMVGSPTARVVRVLQQSQFELFDEFEIVISQDVSYGHNVLVVDIKDPVRGNVSLEPSVEDVTQSFTLMS